MPVSCSVIAAGRAKAPRWWMRKSAWNGARCQEQPPKFGINFVPDYRYSMTSILITTIEELADLCQRLATADYVTVDTEFMRESTFWPILCLAQIAGPDDAVAIDTLAPGMDLSPLFDLMANESVVKVFHAARQDIEIFHHLDGRIPTPLFDSQVAAMVCGFGDSVSYEALASKLAKARIDKSSRLTDWSHRPLTERQLEYAIDDVTHLRVIYERLVGQLEKTGRTAWVAEEMAVLNDPAIYEQHPDNAWRRLKSRSTDGRFLAVLREVDPDRVYIA